MTLLPVTERPTPRRVLVVAAVAWLAGSLGSMAAGAATQQLWDPAGLPGRATVLARDSAPMVVYRDRVITAAQQSELARRGRAGHVATDRGVTGSPTHLLYAFDTAAERDRWACTHLPGWAVRRICAGPPAVTALPSPSPRG